MPGTVPEEEFAITLFKIVAFAKYPQRLHPGRKTLPIIGLWTNSFTYLPTCLFSLNHLRDKVSIQMLTCQQSLSYTSNDLFLSTTPPPSPPPGQ